MWLMVNLGWGRRGGVLDANSIASSWECYRSLLDVRGLNAIGKVFCGRLMWRWFSLDNCQAYEKSVVREIDPRSPHRR